MNFPVTFSYSFFWVIVVIITASVLTYLLYYKRLDSSETGKVLRITLSLIRFFVLLILGLLLLHPFLQKNTKHIQKPLIVVAQDNSQSMLLSADSSFLQTRYIRQRDSLVSLLEQDFDVRVLQFGDTVRSIDNSFSDTRTNFEQLANKFYTSYFNSNIGALIVASDGLYNAGVDPEYSFRGFSFPVYTIPFGDTADKRELKISGIEHNETAFKGTNFPVFISVKSNGYIGKKAEIRVKKEGEIIIKKEIFFDSDIFFTKVPFYIKADTFGIVEYTADIYLPDEKKAIGKKQFFVNIEKEKRKILLLYSGYHPDIAVFKRVVEESDFYNIDIKTPSNFNESVSKYSLVILHGLPSVNNNLQNIITEIIKDEVPVLFILTNGVNISAFNNLHTQMSISQKKGLYDDVFPKINKSFTLFNTSITDDMVANLPPMSVPYGKYKTLPVSNVVLYQQVGKVLTDKPLWVLGSFGNAKAGFICGEGLWRWRIAEYKNNRDHSVTDELIIKTIQYLSINNRKEPLVLKYKHIIDNNSTLIIEAFPYNKSNEIINNLTINLDITDTAGNSYPYVFDEDKDSYILRTTSPVPGMYSFTASYSYGGKTVSKTGKFVVKNNPVESINLKADYSLLYRLAEETGGEMIDKNSIVSLYSKIKTNSNIAPVIYNQKDIIDIYSVTVLFVLLVLLLIADWFLRKYNGLV